MRTADVSGVQHLYHYDTFNADWLLDILTNHRIWVSSPAVFNDPWDFTIDFDVEGLNDPIVLEQEVQGYMRITHRQMPDMPLPKLFARAQYYRNNPDILAQKGVDFALALTTHAEIQYRVYCTGTKWNCELMWAHYGDKHAGICLEFATNNRVFTGALQVEYMKAYPTYRMFAADDDEERDVTRALTAKSDAWSYETEYRLIAQERNYAVGHETLIADGNYLAIPPNCLTSIIIGCMAHSDTVNSIRRMLRDTGHPAVLKRLSRARGRYELLMR